MTHHHLIHPTLNAFNIILEQQLLLLEVHQLPQQQHYHQRQQPLQLLDPTTHVPNVQHVLRFRAIIKQLKTLTVHPVAQVLCNPGGRAT